MPARCVALLALSVVMALLLAGGCRRPEAIEPTTTHVDHAAASAEYRAALQRRVSLYLDEVRGCYERVLSDAPDTRGRVVAEIMVSPAGTVGQARVVQSTVHVPRLEACLVSQIWGWTFPLPPDGEPKVVQYPFVFEPVDAAAGDSP